MRIGRTMVSSVTVLMALGLLLAMPAHAQVTFDDWVGEWFKGSLKEKGLTVDAMGTGKASGKIPSYSYVDSWNVGTQQLTILSIDQGAGGTWMAPITRIVQVLNGTALDFVAYSFVPPATVPGLELFAVAVSVTAKDKKGVLSSPKIKSLGGCVIYDEGGGSYYAANEAISMKGVAEDKVPDEVKALLP